MSPNTLRCPTCKTDTLVYHVEGDEGEGLRCSCGLKMSVHSRFARYKPAVAPWLEHVHRFRGASLTRPYVAVWINSIGHPSAMAACKNYSSAVIQCRNHMNLGGTPSEAHHTRYYVYDSSYATWEPDNLACWTPIAERPRDQWIPAR